METDTLLLAFDVAWAALALLSISFGTLYQKRYCPKFDLRAGSVIQFTAALLLLLRAFSSGCTALTGIEAISNDTQLFRQPRAKNAANTLVVLHSATRALRANSRHDWMQAVEALDRDWFVPVQAAFERKTVTSLTLLLPNEHATLKADLAPPPRFDLFRQISRHFKSGAKPLADYLPHG